MLARTRRGAGGGRRSHVEVDDAREVLLEAIEQARRWHGVVCAEGAHLVQVVVITSVHGVPPFQSWRLRLPRGVPARCVARD